MKDDEKLIEECTQRLLEAIQASSACREYEQARDEIKTDPDAKAAADAYRRKCLQFQNQEDTPEKLDRARDLCEEGERLRGNKLIDRYLSSELVLCRMLQKLSMELFLVTDLETDAILQQDNECDSAAG